MSDGVSQQEQPRQPAGRQGEQGEQCEFQMIQRGDFIKPGWWHWRCRREDAAGGVDYGYVTADTLGRVVVPETFQKDRI